MRYSRALPYELHVTSHVDTRSGRVTLRFDNTGRQGAVFHVYDKLQLDRIPRRYTVEARKSLDDVWSPAAADEGAYDLEVFGPNSFFRSFTGRTAEAGPEVRVRYEVHRRSIAVHVRNHGRRALTVTASANAHRDDGPWNLRLAPGQDDDQRWSVRRSGNWYDFTVAHAASGFARRFAGRLETGHDGISDPALATDLA